MEKLTAVDWWFIVGAIVATVDLFKYKYWKYHKHSWFGIMCIFLYVTIAFPLFLLEMLIKLLIPRE